MRSVRNRSEEWVNLLNFSRKPIMRNSVLEWFRHRRYLVIQADSWVMVLRRLYDLVHLGGREGSKI